MKINITSLVPPEFINTYVFELKFTHGDYDVHTTENLKIDLDAYLNNKLEETIVKLKELLSTNFYSGPYMNLAHTIMEDWPQDILSDGNCYAKLEYWKLYWYDYLGNKYNTEILD